MNNDKTENNTLFTFPKSDDLSDDMSCQDTAFTDEPTQKVLLLAADFGKYDAERSLSELSALCEAAGYEAVAEVLQSLDKAHPATILGTGRLAEAKLIAQNLGVSLVVFDGELSGSQLRNLEEFLELPVIDRTMLILDIFASRAVTHEGKTQTELARLQYRLPRLTGHGQSLSRQGGGGGGGGGARRGGGETKLEYDRRYINTRIATLKQRLEAIAMRRNETRRSRQKSGVPLVALVGYTNVGKSSLVNALCGSNIPAKNQLFATLDATARKLTLPSGQNVVVIDTVGFVSRLPHNLVEAFKSTLEEAKYADILLCVADASNPESATQLAVTNETLSSMNIDESTPRITVYNKCDLVQNFTPFDTSSVMVSANTGAGIQRLLEAIDEKLSARIRRIQVLLPYSKLALADEIRKSGTVIIEDYREDGVYYEATITAELLHIFAPYQI